MALPNIPHAGAYPAAYSQPLPARSGPAYPGQYMGLSPGQAQPQRPVRQVSPMDRSADTALVAADNPQLPGAAMYRDGFIVDTYT